MMTCFEYTAFSGAEYLCGKFLLAEARVARPILILARIVFRDDHSAVLARSKIPEKPRLSAKDGFGVVVRPTVAVRLRRVKQC